MSKTLTKYRPEFIALAIIAAFWVGIWGYQQYIITSLAQPADEHQAQVDEETSAAAQPVDTTPAQ